MGKEKQTRFGTINEVDIKQGDNYTAWKITRLQQDQFNALDSHDQLTYLAHCAHLAPSSHNTQPWRFTLNTDERAIDVHIDKSRVLPASDVKGRQATISIGCAIANLTTASQYFGLQPNIEYMNIDPELLKPSSQTFNDLHLSHISFQAGTTSTNRETFEAIFTRRVNRSKYDLSRTINPTILEDLTTIANENGTNVKLLDHTTLKNRMSIAAIAELQYQADSIVVNSDTFGHELGDWLLPNDTDSYLGMPGDTFGLPDALATEFHDGLLKGNLKGDYKAAFPKGDKEGIESSPLLGIITITSDTPEEWIRAGQTLGGIALFLEKNGLAMAVNAALAEVRMVRSALKPFLDNRHPAIIFRAGYTNEYKPHSPRLPLENVTKS